MEKTNKYSALDKNALQAELTELLKAHFALRMQHAVQQLSNYSQLRNVKRDIARVRTFLAQKG